MTSRDRSGAAALAITFEDKVVRRHLARRYPLDLERAKLALEIAERRERRLEAERDAPAK